MVAATIGKIANEIINLQRTEIGEVEEGFVFGKVGSSTMPHKRNPMISEYLVGLSRLVRNALPLALESMIQEHERDMGLWLTEWASLSEMNLYLHAMLKQAVTIVNGMRVDKERMERNTRMTGGLILSEKIMFRLGQYIGKQTAHELVYRASMRCHEQGRTLLETLCDEEEVMKHFTREQLKEELNPATYTGLSEQFVDRVLERVNLWGSER
jgi:adenylosuccinate lyase